MGNYSKFLGALVGGVLGMLVNVFALPEAWASDEMQGAVIVILSAVLTYVFPPNNPT